MVKLSLEQNSTAMTFYLGSIFGTQKDHENQSTLYQNLLLVPGVHVELYGAPEGGESSVSQVRGLLSVSVFSKTWFQCLSVGSRVCTRWSQASSSSGRLL